MSTNPELATLILNDKLDVKERLDELRECKDKYDHEGKILQDRLILLTNSPVDRQKKYQIGVMKKCLRMSQVGRPIEISPTHIKEMGGIAPLREALIQQYVRFSKEEQLLWLNNLLFIITPSLRKLSEKITTVREFNSIGQQRNFLLGGESGTGKTSYSLWYTWSHRPRVERDYNYLPVVRFDVPKNDKTPRPLLRRIIAAMGMTYNKSDDEDDLLEAVVSYILSCQVEVLIADEIEHIRRLEIRRKLLEISNLTVGVPIVCASCNPILFTQGDSEIQGRWNDFFPLKTYRGKRLLQLLATIELMLPFSQPSGLGISKIKKTEEPDTDKISGPAKFVEAWTKGVLRDIMILIWDASRRAIEKGDSSLTLTRLQESWRNIQSQPPEEDQEFKETTEE